MKEATKLRKAKETAIAKKVVERAKLETQAADREAKATKKREFEALPLATQKAIKKAKTAANAEKRAQKLIDDAVRLAELQVEADD